MASRYGIPKGVCAVCGTTVDLGVGLPTNRGDVRPDGRTVHYVCAARVPADGPTMYESQVGARIAADGRAQ